MRVLVIGLMLLGLLVSPAFAAIEMDVGAKIDAPNLIRITKDITVGIEASKGMLADVFNDRYYFEDDKGFQGFIKITWTGTLFSFVKK